VQFHFNSNFESITPDGAIVNGEVVQADEYVIATPPKIKYVANQVSFRFGFNRKISFEKHNISFVLLDSEYNITFYPQDENWSKDVYLGPVVSLWSGTVTKGNNAVKLKQKELLAEIKRQFLQSKYIKNIISESDIVYEEIFEDWVWDPKSKRLVSKNPAWGNHVNEIRPLNSTEHPNIWIAGAHTKTTTDVWCMESAVESGKLASNLILEKYKKKKCVVMSHKIKFATFDDQFYDLGLPHFLDCFLITLVIVFIVTLFHQMKLFQT
jgi:hypothetical protein